MIARDGTPEMPPMSASNPTASIIVREQRGQPFYEAKFRYGLDFRSSQPGGGPCVLDLRDFRWCGGQTPSWVILGGDDDAPE
ncbi:MAG: hypothetical protein ACRDK7_14305, partial [Solirubrobacteraceae bacterium]